MVVSIDIFILSSLQIQYQFVCESILKAYEGELSNSSQ